MRQGIDERRLGREGGIEEIAMPEAMGLSDSPDRLGIGVEVDLWLGTGYLGDLPGRLGLASAVPLERREAFELSLQDLAPCERRGTGLSPLPPIDRGEGNTKVTGQSGLSKTKRRTELADPP
ncbi:MAG: hypothetical protein Q8Q58_11625 [Candidatus Rokubacteria bacterium]|nr:hypothetical protein [Candidatus Rokubacteria bacterium]